MNKTIEHFYIARDKIHTRDCVVLCTDKPTWDKKGYVIAHGWGFLSIDKLLLSAVEKGKCIEFKLVNND